MDDVFDDDGRAEEDPGDEVELLKAVGGAQPSSFSIFVGENNGKKSDLSVVAEPLKLHSFLVFFSAFISSVQYCVILPTCLTYAKELDGGPLVSGLLVGGADICSIPVTLLLPALTKKGYKDVFLFQAILGVVGNLLYANAGALESKVALVSGRVLAGIVAAYSFTCPNFIGYFVPERHRTKHMQILYSSVYCGVALGPVIGALLMSIRSFRFGFVRVDANTAPGYFMSLCYLGFTALVFWSPKFPRAPVREDFTLRSVIRAKAKEPLLEDFWRKFAIGVTILGTSVPAFLDGGWEVATVLIASERWGWKESRTGYMIGGVLGSVLFSNGMVAWLSYRYEDRWIILAFFVLLLAAIGLLFDFGVESIKVKVGMYVAGGLMYMPAVSIISSCFSSITTKIVKSGGEMMLLQTINGILLQLSLFSAAIFGTEGMASIGQNAFFSFILFLSFALFLCTCTAFRQLKPK